MADATYITPSAMGAQPPWETTRTKGINGTWPLGPGEMHDNNNSPLYTSAFHAVGAPNIQSRQVVRCPEPFVKAVPVASAPPVRYPDLTSIPGLINPPESTMRELMTEQVMTAQVNTDPMPMDVDKDTVPGPGPLPVPRYNEGLVAEDLMTKMFGPTTTNRVTQQFGMPQVSRV